MTRNERTSSRVAKIAGRILAANRRDGLYVTSNFKKYTLIRWGDIRALAASCLTQTADRTRAKNAHVAESDHSDHAKLRKGKLPKGHKRIKRHKAVVRNHKGRAEPRG